MKFQPWFKHETADRKAFVQFMTIVLKADVGKASTICLVRSYLHHVGMPVGIVFVGIFVEALREKNKPMTLHHAWDKAVHTMHRSACIY